jgi:hypothetical protein
VKERGGIWSSYFTSNGWLNPLIKPTIALEGADADTEGTPYHELGHFLMWNLQGKSHILAFGPHSLEEESRLRLAWSEGWANAIEYIMDGAHHWEDEEYGGDDGSNNNETRIRAVNVQRGLRKKCAGW